MPKISGKVDMSQNNIFAFWESPNPIPAYLDLCKETWIKNIPNCRIHILNHSNLHEYIGDIYEMEDLKSISFAMQSDIISAAVLEKFGGLFLDLDCIVTDNIFDIFDKISDTKLISFGRPDTNAIHLAVLYCRKPNNPILREWRKVAQARLKNRPEKYPWHYFGNGIINPLFGKSEYKDYYYILDRTQSGNILESVVFPNSSDPISDYKNFYFNPKYNFTPNVLDNVKCGVISLHNSWSPQEYKTLYEKEIFYTKYAPIVQILSYILQNSTKRNYDTLPIIESFIVSKLKYYNISYTRKYFKKILVIDFSVNNIKFAFDISMDEKSETISLDVVFRDSISEKAKDFSCFKDVVFNKNKGHILTDKEINNIWNKIIIIYSALKNNDRFIFPKKANLTDKIIDLQSFKISGSILFLEGIGILQGQSAKEYGDINYQLIFKNRNNKLIKKLAKGNHPELTAYYSAFPNVYYDKCWFATAGYKGIDISDIPQDEYELLLNISINGFNITSPISSSKEINVKNKFFEFLCSEKGNTFLIKENLKRSNLTTIDFFAPLAKFTNNKLKVSGYYEDEFNNIIEAPFDLQNVHVQFFGKNNKVILHEQSNLKNTFIEFKGDNATFSVDGSVGIFGTFRLGHKCQINIGQGTTSTNPVYVTCAESTKISIGEDCMFATNNQIRTDDSHAIYDVNTGKRVNPSKDIIIGKHVWVAYGATILGGSNIGSGSVIGAYSLVKNSIPNNCVAVGIPAKVIKEDIFWERPLLLNEKSEKIYSSEYLEQTEYVAKTRLENLEYKSNKMRKYRKNE